MLTKQWDKTALTARVCSEISEILAERGTQVSPAAGDYLDGLGLGSLDLARLVAALEMDLQVDPFQELVAITSVRTVADVAEAYLLALQGTPSADDDLEAAALRAKQRRSRRL